MSKTRSYEQLIEGMGPTITTEGPNFPVTGLTKREYFAAMAMQGIVSNSFWAKKYFEARAGDDKYRVATVRTAMELAAALIEKLDGVEDEN